MTALNPDLRFLFQLELKGTKYVLAWCIENGLISKSFVCCNCGHLMQLAERNDISDGYQWYCRVRERFNKHYVRRSMRIGSWFSLSRLPLSIILQITYLWIYNVSSEFIMQEIQVVNNTVLDWKMYCRNICVEMCIKESVKLGGPGVIIEIYESKCSKRKFNKRRKNGNWMVAGVERGANKCFFRVVESKSKEILLDVIKENILPESVIMSDCWKTYDCVLDQNFIQLQAKHGIIFKDMETNTRNSDGAWSAVKQSLYGARQRTDDFDSYLAEYVWRRVHSSDPEGLFMSFIKSVVQIYPPQIKD